MNYDKYHQRDSDAGIYIAVFHLAEARDISVGKLGRFGFRQGVYFYAGSAQRNLPARLERHSRKSKPMRWHIDYLSVRAEMLGAITVAAPRHRECELAGCLNRRRLVSERPTAGAGVICSMRHNSPDDRSVTGLP